MKGQDPKTEGSTGEALEWEQKMGLWFFICASVAYPGTTPRSWVVCCCGGCFLLCLSEFYFILNFYIFIIFFFFIIKRSKLTNITEEQGKRMQLASKTHVV